MIVNPLPDTAGGHAHFVAAVADLAVPVSAVAHVVVASTDHDFIESHVVSNPDGSAARESEVRADAGPNIRTIFVVRNDWSVTD